MQNFRAAMIGNLSQTIKPLCEDDVKWANGYFCQGEGKRESQGCTEAGWTCKAYELWGWCADGKVLQDWSIGDHLKNPDAHCCVCGGGAQEAGEDPDALRYEGYLDAGSRLTCADTPLAGDDSGMGTWGNGQVCIDGDEGCTVLGLTCEAYAARAWCEDGNLTMPGYGGALFNTPEVHCCVCGGGKQALTQAQDNGFFLYDCVTHCGFMNSPKWNTLSNGFLTLREAFSVWYFFGANVRSTRAAGRNWGRHANPTCFK